MILHLGDNTPISQKGARVKGLILHANLTHGTVNTPINPLTDFLAQNVTVNVVLKRNGKQVNIFSNNLLLHALHSMKHNGYEAGFIGLDYAKPAAGVYARKTLSFFLNFGGTIVLSGSDELFIQVNFANSALSSNINAAASNLDVYPMLSQGVAEYGVPVTTFEVIMQNAANQDVNFDDNTMLLNFINLDQDDLQNLVIQSVGLSSDKISKVLQAYQLYAEHQFLFTNKLPVRFKDTPGNYVAKVDDYSPQTVKLFGELPDINYDVTTIPNTLKAGKISLVLNSANVNSSKNYIGKTSLLIDGAAQSRFIQTAKTA